LSSKSVFIVDDDVHIRRVLEVKLKKSGFKIRMAKNGQVALEMVRQDIPSVMITDINMPIMDGKALCMQTNPLKKENSFLTIVVTARIDPEEKQWVKTMKDTILMEKPFSPMAILETIQRYLGASS